MRERTIIALAGQVMAYALGATLIRAINTAPPVRHESEEEMRARMAEIEERRARQDAEREERRAR